MAAGLNNDSLRALERGSIATFVKAHSHLYSSTACVLDYGCGKQPYREYIEAKGAKYVGFDRVSFSANVSEEDVGDANPLKKEWDVIVTTQTIQYVAPWHVHIWLAEFCAALFARRGTLLMTGPTTWPLVEPQDICRYTPQGIDLVLRASGFREVSVEVRAPFKAGSVNLNCGWQAVARP